MTTPTTRTPGQVLYENLYPSSRGTAWNTWDRLRPIDREHYETVIAAVLSHSAPAGAAPAVGAGEAVAGIFSKFGDPEAFGEREIEVLVDLKKFKYGTKLYAHPAPQVAADERPAFEAWALKRGHDIDRGHAGGYLVYSTNIQWQAWQARSASPAPAHAAPADAAQPAGEVELPPLPAPAIMSYQQDSTMRTLQVLSYSADQVRAYARLALSRTTVPTTGDAS